MAARRSVVTTVEEAATLIHDGDTIGIGGFVTTNKPCAIIRELAKQRRKDLTIVAAPSSVEVDLLIGLGCVKELITPYMGAEALAPVTPFFGAWAGRRFKTQETDNGTLIAMLKSRIQRVPFLPVQVVGTSICDHNEYVSVIDDPFGGPPVAVARPVKIDVAIIHAMRADKYGNVQHRGAHFLDHLFAMAADKVVVQVERIVSNETIRSTALDTTLPCEFVTAVAEAPHGAHPTASQNFYRLDTEFIKVYVDASRAFLAGEPDFYNKMMQRFVYEPWTHADYCEAIGMQRLFGLSLEGSDD